MKTLKQIADEIGTDKQRVYRFVVKNGITASSEVKQSKLYDEAAERLIKKGFNHIIASNERCGEAHQKSGREQLLEQLIRELETKNGQIKEKDRQLAEKDRQINAVHEMLAENQRLLDQQQQLNAIAEQRIKLLEQRDVPDIDGDGQNQQPEPEENYAMSQKTSFWNRLWHRN